MLFRSPQQLQQIATRMSADDIIQKQAYSGYTPLKFPFVSQRSTQIPPNTNIMKYYAGRSTTFGSGVNNLVLKLPNANGRLEKVSLDWATLPPFVQTYIQHSLAELHRTNPKKFPSANWADYKAVSVY